MSEEKTTSYRLEYAYSGRSSCKGPKPCTGTNIPKGALRLGTPVDFRGNKSFAWRHWGCTTKKVIENIKKNFEDASELDGYEDLKPEDQAKIRQAYRDGHVANEDIPETARKPAREEGEEEVDEEKPKKKRAPAKNSKKVADEDGEKPKTKRAPRKKAEDADEKAETAVPKEWASKKKQEGDSFGDFSKELDDIPAEDGNDEATEKPAEKVKGKAKEALVEGFGESSTFTAYVDRHCTRPVSPTFHHALDQEKRNHRRSHLGGVAPTTSESLDSVLERVGKCEQALDGIHHASLEKRLDQNSDNLLKVVTDLENFRNETHKFFAEMITALGDRHKHNPYTCEDCLKHPALLPPPSLTS